jgi:hypothetical protein
LSIRQYNLKLQRLVERRSTRRVEQIIFNGQVIVGLTSNHRLHDDYRSELRGQRRATAPAGFIAAAALAPASSLTLAPVARELVRQRA